MLYSFASSPFCKQPVAVFMSLAFSDFCDFSYAVATRTKAINGTINAADTKRIIFIFPLCRTAGSPQRRYSGRYAIGPNGLSGGNPGTHLNL
jgi:hypothetical protein